METPKPILVGHQFPEVLQELTILLKSISADDWQKPTICSSWSVKDVALHLLGGEIGNLSRRRDHNVVSNTSINDWSELVSFINQWNQSWVFTANRISTRLLIELLEFVGSQLNEYFQNLNPYAVGGVVSWAGPDPAPIWLDLAREYTERWHHQQHIRDAVDKPGLKQPKYFSPVIETLMWAIPRTYQKIETEENIAITITITGLAGGQWSICKEAMKWKLYTGTPVEPASEITMDQEVAWRVFTRGISPEIAKEQVIISGNQTLGLKALETVAIIA